MLALSWIIAMSSKSPAQKQVALINEAITLINDGIFIRAVPLLEEAAAINAAHTITAEEELKKAYIALINNRGYSRRYTNLLEKQMNRRDVSPDVFIEAANYFLSTSKTQEALKTLKAGIEATGDEAVSVLYEQSRYVYELSRVSYEDVTEIFNNAIQVKADGKWGIASADGVIIIPCMYEQISTFSNGRVIVRNNSNVYAVDKDNNRIAIAREHIASFGNFSENRIPLNIEGVWRRATGDFELGESAFDDFGMYSGGYAAAKVNGSWGIVGLSNKWLIDAEFDEIIRDELGRSYAQGAVFFSQGGIVHLHTGGALSDETFDDAHPFSDTGYAAVKRNGKWGFIDAQGTEKIPFIFEDALSFGQHLAAVKIGEYWGYISMTGDVVIDAVYLSAKSFSGGCAPVLTQRGWQFITLIEYKKGVSL